MIADDNLLPDHPHLARGEARQEVLRAAMPRRTPLLEISATFLDQDRRIMAKAEGFQHSRSMKYRPALLMAQEAIRLAAAPTSSRIGLQPLFPGSRLVESSSGSFGVALAHVGKLYQHPVTIIVDEKLEPYTRDELLALGADLYLPEGDPGTVTGQVQRRLARDQYLRSLKDCWMPDQYRSPNNPKSYRPMAAEIVSQLDGVTPDVLVTPVGTGGNSNGVGHYLRERFPDIRIVGVDTINSTIFGQDSGDRIMSGMGGDIVMLNVDHDLFNGGVHLMDPATAMTWARKARHANPDFAGGWSVGSVMAAAVWEANQQPPGSTVVAIFPDGPNRYEETLYNDEYCRAKGLLDREIPAEPDQMPTTTSRSVDSWTYAERATIRLSPF